jgi:hypothetical protein
MAHETQPGHGGESAELSVLDRFLTEAGWAAWVVTLLGSTSLAAFASNATTKPGRAGPGDFGTLVVAGVAALALTLGVALAVGIYEYSDPKPAGYQLVWIATASLFGGTLVANVLGFLTVGLEDLTHAVSANSNGHPVATLIAVVFAFVVAYGWVVAAQGAVVGFLLGRWAGILARD